MGDLVGLIDWDADPEALRRGDLSGLPMSLVMAIQSAARLPEIAAFIAIAPRHDKANGRKAMSHWTYCTPKPGASASSIRNMMLIACGSLVFGSPGRRNTIRITAETAMLSLWWFLMNMMCLP